MSTFLVGKSAFFFHNMVVCWYIYICTLFMSAFDENSVFYLAYHLASLSRFSWQNTMILHHDFLGGSLRVYPTMSTTLSIYLSLCFRNICINNLPQDNDLIVDRDMMTSPYHVGLHDFPLKCSCYSNDFFCNVFFFIIINLSHIIPLTTTITYNSWTTFL